MTHATTHASADTVSIRHRRARSRLLCTVTGVALAIGLVILPATAAPAEPARPAAAATNIIETHGCQTASAEYPWGELPLRTWTPNNTQAGAGSIDNPSIAQGESFSARLVRANGRDAAASRQNVVLEYADGCRRSYAGMSFIDADRKYVSRMMAEHRPIPDPAEYALWYDPAYVTAQEEADGVIEVHQTQHFAIWYGTDESAFSYGWQRDRGIEWSGGIETLGAWMEEAWLGLRDITGAPMPYADAATADKRKVNIYICGTGFPWRDGSSDSGDCGASAGALSMFVSAVYILDGSTTMTHEFGHVLQQFTGGFQGGIVPGVGKVWEAHANWQATMLNPEFNIWYYENLENGPTWWTNYYGWYPLLLQLHENDDTRDYPWRAWQENARRDDGQSTEDFLETVVRLGQQDGLYPRGFASFADDLGWYGARLAANDFIQGKVFADTIDGEQEASRYVGLTPTDTVREFASPSDRPLWQFGSHIIPLDVSPDATSVSVSLTGDSDAADAAWRYSLVSVAPDGSPTYSLLGAASSQTGGTIKLPVTPGHRTFLAVTATPATYAYLGDAEAPDPAPTTFDYLVSLDGARPSLPGSGACLGPFVGEDALNLNWNTNGHFSEDRRCATSGPDVRVTRQPTDVTVDGSASAATFEADVSGRVESMQWQTTPARGESWRSVPGADSSTLTLQAGVESGTRVRLIVTSSTGQVVSSRTATLTRRGDTDPSPSASPEPSNPASFGANLPGSGTGTAERTGGDGSAGGFRLLADTGSPVECTGLIVGSGILILLGASIWVVTIARRRRSRP